jgi:hypothetical protein
MRPPELFAWLPALLGTAALVGFLVLSGLALVPAVLLLFGFAALYPYRHHSSVARHLLWLLLLAAVLWLLQSLGLLLLPTADCAAGGVPVLTRYWSGSSATGFLAGWRRW